MATIITLQCPTCLHKNKRKFHALTKPTFKIQCEYCLIWFTAVNHYQFLSLNSYRSSKK